MLQPLSFGRDPVAAGATGAEPFAARAMIFGSQIEICLEVFAMCLSQKVCPAYISRCSTMAGCARPA